MARLTITLTDDELKWVARAAGERGFGGPAEYLQTLIAEGARTDASEADEGHDGAPDHLRVGSREHLEALLLEGARSPAREMTVADWAEMRRRFVARHAAAQGR